MGLASACPASAHAPPEVLQVVSAGPGDVIVATTRGLVFGSGDTKTWALLCNEAFGVTSSAQYRTARLPSSGRLLVGEQGGLRVSDDRGCSWRPTPTLGTLHTPSLAQSRAKPDRVYVSVYAMDGVGVRPGEGGIRVSDDGGDTFRTLYTASDTEFIGSLLVAEGEPAHLYAIATGLGAASLSHVLLHSDDGGTNWARRAIESAPQGVDVTLLAVNPRDPLELLARAGPSAPTEGERLLWSRDGGRSFSAAGTYKSIRSASFSPDGTSAHATHLDGLLRASTPERRFERVGVSTRLSSVEALDDALLVGGYYAGAQSAQDGVGVAHAADLEASFAPFMNFADIRAPLRCPPPSTVERDCALLWLDWSRELGFDRPPSELPDSGTSATNASAAPPAIGPGAHDGGAPDHADERGGCTVRSRRADAWGWLPLLGILWRRRRPRVPAHRADISADPELAERTAHGVHR